MENETNSNWTPPSGGQNTGQQPVPNATASLVLGIVSLCTTVLLCCCYGYIIGLITSIIGLVLGSGAMKKFNAEPGVYTDKSFGTAKTGRLLNIIGLILSIVVIALIILMVALKATGNLPDEFEKYDRYNRNF